MFFSLGLNIGKSILLPQKATSSSSGISFTYVVKLSVVLVILPAILKVLSVVLAVLSASLEVLFAI